MLNDRRICLDPPPPTADPAWLRAEGRWAPHEAPVSLFRIQLDDQLFLHGQVDLLARRERGDAPAHRAGVEREPVGDTAALDLFHRVLDGRVLRARGAHADDVTGLHRVRRDVDLLAVHREVPVAHQLPRLRPRGREAQAVDHVVHAPLEQLQQRLAGDAARALRHLEVAAELVLEDAVNALDLLLLAQLQAVADQLGLAQLAVLPRRQVALLDGALLRVAALSLEEKLHPFAPAQPADRTDVTCHVVSCRFQFPVTSYTRRRFG